MDEIVKWLYNFSRNSVVIEGRRKGGGYETDEKGVAKYDDTFIRQPNSMAIPLPDRIVVSDLPLKEELERCKANAFIFGGPVPNPIARIIMYEGKEPFYLRELKPKLPWVFNLMPTDPHHEENLSPEDYQSLTIRDLNKLEEEPNWSLVNFEKNEELIPDLYNDKKRVGTDYGIIVFSKNPLDIEKRVILCAGCHGFGSTATGLIIRNVTTIEGNEKILKEIGNLLIEDKPFVAVVECKVKENEILKTFLYEITEI